jgi:hypothetical protein
MEWEGCGRWYEWGSLNGAMEATAQSATVSERGDGAGARFETSVGGTSYTVRRDTRLLWVYEFASFGFVCITGGRAPGIRRDGSRYWAEG